jgi:uncharacterized protein
MMSTVLTEELMTGQDNATAPKRPNAPLVLYLLLFFCVWALRATVLFFVDESIRTDFGKAVYSNAFKLLVWVLPVFLYLKLYERRRPLRYLKLTTRPARNGLALAALASALFFSAVVIFERFTSGRNLESLYRASAHAIGLALLSVAVSPVLEEVLFRGFVLGELWERMSFLRADLLTSALFVLAHWPYWLWANGFGKEMLGASLSVFILAVFLGYVLKWTNSLWPCVAIHIFNNFLSAFLRV